ncbi:MAG: pectate lyase [Prevotella sp.]|nr:pectate lyase [Prevotella sp.]
MYKKLFSIFIFISLGVTLAQAQAPAFPGAEGHGRYVTGGRGGEIRHVTNLNDSGTGSLRAAVSGSTKKIVVFDVGGVIALKSDLGIGANTTIAGQTAPAPGITLRYYTVQPNGDNIILRYIRSRRGQEKDVNDGADAIWTRNKTGIILDHCSFSWSIDEVASFYDNNNFTMQWCTLGESLNNAGHGKGAHGYGGIWGGKLASFHHNLIAHVNNRSPRFNGARYEWQGYKSNKLYNEYQWENEVQAEIVDFRNCVIYNCGNGCYGGPGGGYINIINNYYKTGPAGSTSRVTTVSIANSTSSADNKKYWDMTSRYYINGNQVNDNANYDWTNVSYDSGVFTINGERYTYDNNHYYGNSVTYVKNSNGNDCVKIKLDEPTQKGEVTTHSATTAFNKVLDYAGASLDRDDVDARYAQEAKNGTATYTGSVTGKKGRIDLVSDVNGYTEENFGKSGRTEGFDTDNDGMPDLWETANGLNPNDASDAKTYTLDSSKQWYTNLEVYLSSLVEDIMKAGNADATESVDEYYPTCTKVDLSSTVKVFDEGGSGGGGNTGPDTPIETSKVIYYWLDSFSSANEVTFNDGAKIAITGNTGKNITSAKDITIEGSKYTTMKLSNGAQNTLTMPEGCKVVKMTFYSYINKASSETERISYWKEVAGVTFDETNALSCYNDGDLTKPDVREFTLATPSNDVTFTNNGDQLCYVLAVDYTKGGSSGIEHPVSINFNKDEFYNLNGQKVSQPVKGIYILKQKDENGKTLTRKVIKK